jgi:hypothetical protein
MKYQVGVYYKWEGEFAIEADSKEEAREFVRDELFSDPWNDSDGSSEYEIIEIYEWDEAAQERHSKEIEEQFAKVQARIDARRENE